MANPTTMVAAAGSEHPQDTIEATTTQQRLQLDPDRSYTIAHNGLDVSAGAAVTTIFFRQSNSATGITVTETLATGNQTGALIQGRSIVLPAGYEYLFFKTASGSPTFHIQESEHLLRNH